MVTKAEKDAADKKATQAFADEAAAKAGTETVEQKQRRDENEGVKSNTIKVVWESDEEGGEHTVLVTGKLEFVIKEHALNGEIVYRSGLFRSDQDDLKDAIGVAVKNGVHRAFITKWNEINPPEQRERKGRERMADKVARSDARAASLEAVVVEMTNAMVQQREVDWAVFDAAGIDPAQFGLERPKDK